MAAKLAMRDALLARNVEADVEVEVHSLPGDRRADVLAVAPNKKIVAFEFQHTNLTIEAIEARAASYSAESIAQIWVPFLAPAALERAEWSDDGRLGTITAWLPPSYVLWAQDIQGFLWLIDRSGRYWRAEIEDHIIVEPDREWVTEEGEERFSRGGPRPAKNKRDLTIRGPYRAQDLRIRIMLGNTKRDRRFRGRHRLQTPVVANLEIISD